MNQQPETIRNSVRAVIIKDEQLLILRKQSDTEPTFYALPGGAQKPGESLTQAVVRECMEEIGAKVDIGAMLHVADYLKQRHSPPSVRHQVEFLFNCHLIGEYTPHNGPEPDKYQQSVEWIPLDELGQSPLAPLDLRAVLGHKQPSSTPIYLGTIS